MNERSSYMGMTMQQASDQHDTTGTSLDDLIHSRTWILKTKLDVLASEIHERLRLRTKNMQRIDDDKERANEMIRELTRLANYCFREHKEKSQFYQQLSDLEKERRLQDVECWRDVVMVMRDFLLAWEAHEQMKERANFLSI